MYQNLKNVINQYIKTNGARSITGALLNGVLNDMVDALGAVGGYGGIITPTSAAPQSDGNVFFVSNTAGTYTNFSNIVVNENELAFIYRSGNGWAKDGITLSAGGTDVEANPTGEATETLTKIGINGTVYSNPKGDDGLPAYVHIMYSVAMPDSNDDMHAVFAAGDKYIGICSDNNATAPATYTSYQWARFVGASGGGGLTAEEREAIVALFRACVYTTGTGIDDLIDIIENSTPKTLTGISVAWVDGSQPTVYAGENIDDLKNYLIVTASYDDNSTATVTNYTLLGDLSTQGTTQVTASYTEDGVTETAYFNVVVSAAVPQYLITNNLSGCTTNNANTYIYEGQTYTAQITASSGNTINGATVQITMEGNDITSTAYNSSTGAITIASVTGAIVITITAAVLTLTAIEAIFNPPSGTTFTSGQSVDDLKQYLTVTPTWSNPDGNSPTEINENDYTLSPSTLSVGSNTITVTYGGETDDFTVTAIASPDIVIGPNGIVIGYSISATYYSPNYPYSNQKSSRAAYLAFDKLIDNDSTYNIVFESNYNDAFVSFELLSQSALDKVANNESFISNPATSVDRTATSYYGVSNGFSLVVPQYTMGSLQSSEIRAVRAIFKIGDAGTTDIPNDFTATVKFYKQS